MVDIKISDNEKIILMESLKNYLDDNFDISLEQFDAEFLYDFIIENFGPPLFNKGIDEAMSTYTNYVELIQEQVDLKRKI